MNAYTVQLNLSADQEAITQKLKGAGAEVIQTSGGLCFKTALSQAELTSLLGMTAKRVNPADSELSPDVRKFLVAPVKPS